MSGFDLHGTSARTREIGAAAGDLARRAWAWILEADRALHGFGWLVLVVALFWIWLAAAKPVKGGKGRLWRASLWAAGAASAMFLVAVFHR